jgi:cell division protein FtsB
MGGRVNNLTDTELDTLEQQYRHVSQENARLMEENRTLRNERDAIRAAWARHGCTMPRPHIRHMHKAITGKELP